VDLAQHVQKKGVLALWNHEESYGIPVANIREWTVWDLSEEEREDAQHDNPPQEVLDV